MQSISESFYIWIEDLLMRLIRGIFSGVAHEPILDASSALNFLQATFIRSLSIDNIPRRPGLQIRSPVKPLDSGGKKVDRPRCRVHASGASSITKVITNDTRLPCRVNCSIAVLQGKFAGRSEAYWW